MEKHLPKVVLISKGEEQLLGSASQTLFPFGCESSFCAQNVHQQEKKIILLLMFFHFLSNNAQIPLFGNASFHVQIYHGLENLLLRCIVSEL